MTILDAAQYRLTGSSRALIFLVLGIVLLGAAFAVGGQKDDFWFAWLFSVSYWLSIGLGGLFFVLVLFATKAGWGVVVRRLAENAAATLIPVGILAIPIFTIARHDLFKWTKPGVIEADHLLQAKTWWLNDTFVWRGLIWLLPLMLFAWWYRSQSIKQDESGSHAITRKLQNWSYLGILSFAILVTAASVDWLMGLDAHWYSTMFGVYYFAGCLVGIFGFLVVVTVVWMKRLDGAVNTEHYHDLGKLLFAFTVFWAYIAFSQYFLIWYGNIPEETLWFLHRAEGSWAAVTVVLAVGHFAIPFFFLMSRHIKRRLPLLFAGGVWMLLMHALDVYWIVKPVVDHHGLHVSPSDILCFLGVGGVFLGSFLWFSSKAALVPVNDPRLPESLGFENF